MKVGVKIRFKDGNNAVELGFDADTYFTVTEYDAATQSIRIADDMGVSLPSHFSIEHFDINSEDITTEMVGARMEHLERIEEHASWLLTYPEKKFR